jgi:hypothetical protein
MLGTGSLTCRIATARKLEPEYGGSPASISQTTTASE